MAVEAVAMAMPKAKVLGHPATIENVTFSPYKIVLSICQECD